MKLLRTENVTTDVRSFIFEPEVPTSWRPGQYFHYVLPHDAADDRGEERWFTCSSAPSEGHVMITTRLSSDPGSSFKRAFQALQPGETIEADGPEGDFVVDDPARNYIFIAGGIGITPFRAMLVEAARQGTQLHVTLLYANRSDDIPFADELNQLAVANPQLTIEYIVNPDKIDEQSLRQHLDAAKDDDPIVYVSGPEPMVKAMAQQLGDLGLAEHNIKIDDFPGYEAY